MPKEPFKVNALSKSSWDNLAKQIEAYRRDLPRKYEEIVRRLIAVGQPIIEQEIANAQITYDSKGIESGADTSHHTDIKITAGASFAHASYTVSGREIVFIEFGSGVYHNTPPGSSSHPKGQEFGFVIGSYGQHKGVQQVWGYYDDNGDLVLTHGVMATMPMYKAVQEMYRQAPRIVREVFAQ